MAAKKSADFMIKHYPPVAEWADPIGWCAWYIDHGFMVALHREEDDSIIGMAAARPVNHELDGNTPYKHAAGGPCIFIDFLAIEGQDPLVLPTFARELRQRFGERKQVAWRRIVSHEYESFLRNAGRIRNVGEPHESAIAT